MLLGDTMPVRLRNLTLTDNRRVKNLKSNRVATAEGEIADHANQGSRSNSDSSQFVGAHVVVLGAIALIIVILRFCTVGR